MVKGLDIGTAFIVGMFNKGKELVSYTQRDAFFEAPNNEFTRQQMINGSDVNYVIHGDKLFIVGDKSLEFGEVFGQEVRRPLAKGYISNREPEALIVIRSIIEGVLGDEPAKSGDKVVYSIPADACDDVAKANALVYHRESLKKIIESLGYEAEPLNEAIAVGYAGLQEHGYTGIAISFGSGMTNFAVMWMSMPVCQFAITRGGDWIDQSTSLAIDSPIPVVRSLKEDSTKFSLNKKYEAGTLQALSVYYTELISYSIHTIQKQFGAMSRKFPRALPIAISGGTSAPKGFVDIFKTILAKTNVVTATGDKVVFGDVFQVSDPFKAVAKGCLIKGLL